MNFIKKDLLISLIIGEIAAWLVVILVKGFLSVEFYAKYANLILFGLPIAFPIICAVALHVAYIISKKFAIIYQIAKFILIGGFNTLVDWGILALAIFLFRNSLNIEKEKVLFVALSVTIIYYSFFKAISFVIATVNSYFWNKFWTFKRKTSENTGKEFLQFLIISIVGFLINVGIASAIFKFVTPMAGINSDQWSILAAVVATAISMIWNFLGYKFVVFEDKKEAPTENSDQQIYQSNPQKRIV